MISLGGVAKKTIPQSKIKDFCQLPAGNPVAALAVHRTARAATALRLPFAQGSLGALPRQCDKLKFEMIPYNKTACRGFRQAVLCRIKKS